MPQRIGYSPLGDIAADISWQGSHESATIVKKVAAESSHSRTELPNLAFAGCRGRWWILISPGIRGMVRPLLRLRYTWEVIDETNARSTLMFPVTQRGTRKTHMYGRNELKAMREREIQMKALKNNEGFTLIELLVVVAIIGILAAIAIPQFALYRQRGFDARAQSDLRNAATAEEAYYAVNSAYKSTSNANSQADIGFTCSKGVTLAITAGTGTFTGTSMHSVGSITWSYDSAAGGFTIP